MFFILFQAIAVAVICLGSLINFHQYKIWGKPLIPTFVGYKRDIEKYSKVLSFSKFSRTSHFSQQHYSGTAGVMPSEFSCVSYGPGTFISADPSQKIPVSIRRCACSPRAPPVA